MNKYNINRIKAFLLLEVFMIERNKKPRQNFYQIVLIYLLLLFFLYLINQKSSVSIYQADFFYTFFLTALSGIFIFLHGLFLLTWDSTYFEGLNVGTFDVKSFFKAKYYLLFTSTILFFLLTLPPLLFIDKKLLLKFISVTVFNGGCTSFLIIFYSLFNNERASLNRSILFNDEGYGIWQYSLMMFFIALPGIILYSLSFLMDIKLSVIILCCLGVISFMCQKMWFSLIKKIFIKRKYKILLRFSETL